MNALSTLGRPYAGDSRTASEICAQQPQPLSSIESAMQNLGEAIDLQGGRFKELIARLEPALRPAVPTPAVNTAGPNCAQPMLSPLVLRIHESADYVRSLAAATNDLHDRLDV